MKFEISQDILKEKSFCVVVGKGINNRTAKSRDIIIKLEKLKEKKKLPNINPFVNFFNSFVLENDIKGFYADLDSIFGDLKWAPLEKEIPFLPVGGKKVLFCSQGERAIFDDHSVTHKVEGFVHGERVGVAGESKNVLVCFVCRKDKEPLLQQLTSSFAKGANSYLGGSWEVYQNSPIEIDFETKKIGESLDATSDLEKLAKSKIKGDKGLKKRRGDSLGFVNKGSMQFELNAIVIGVLKNIYRDFDFENRNILSKSPDFKFGHFSTNIAFELSKTLDEKVHTVAQKLAVELEGETGEHSVFKKIEIAKNGFVNFFLTDEYLFNYTSKAFSNFQNFSSCDVGKEKVILIESPSANPNKAMHVGHLLNVFLAQSLKAIFEKLGFEVHNDNIINDKGLPICKAMWALEEFGSGLSPETEGMKPDHFVDKYYVLGAQKFKESKEVESQVREMLVKWESGDEQIVALWRRMISWVLEGHKETMKRLGEEMGHMWFESEIYEVGKKIVEENIDGERVVKTSDGAVVAKLEKEYGVPDVVLLKSDGTSLYHTQDLGLTKLKIERFNPWLAIWVVGNEQITHFQRLFSLIDSLGLLPIDNLYHLAYGYVFDKNGKKMSSRGGGVLSGDELLDIVKDATGDEDIALGALKYAFLSSDPFKDMKFDLDKAVQFNGRSGPYVVYAHARACSILKNIKNVDDDIENIKLTDLNREILLKCLDYPNVIIACANSYSPSILAEYLYDLAKLFSQMYETEKVLDARGDERIIRLLIVKFVREVLKDGLCLLRIKPLERM